ncbi:hypothetical protein CC78DRAFT_584875 [Lojkania enalia]|uniref:Uncharacterized protein n=1 Tax=Lojkania enalia TaxID=147567 RepID=A0A9P4K1J1_9PLEO|nr:hypothetical protein CC78DRAFT_584875 [Didymosphaeria enalia]
MCNGSSARISHGGSIAVLRPCLSCVVADPHQEWILLFSNRSTDDLRSGTQVEIQGWKPYEKTESNGYWVIIHHDGDLSTSASTFPPDRIPSNPLFSFPLESDPAAPMRLPQKLDLGVGDSGIIGRRVSIMTSSIKGPTMIAEGIIGWN